MDTHNDANEIKISIDNERIIWLDIAKGLLIILVVVGHVLKGTTKLSVALIWFINSFHMPAFLIISGMLTKYEKIQQTSFVDYAKKRSIRLLIPYVCFELIGGFWQMIWFGTEHVNIKGIVAGILSIRCHVGADWFLPTLFFAELCLYLLIRVNKKGIYIVSTLLAMYIAFKVKETSYIVGNGKRIAAALIFLLMGYLFKKYFMKNSVKLFFVAFVSVILVAYTNKTVGIAIRQFNKPILFMLGGILGAYMVFFVSQKIVQHRKISKLLKNIGMASLVIMGTHQNVIIPFNVFMGNWTSFGVKVLILLVTIPVEMISIKLCKKYIPSWVGVSIREINGKNNETKK